MFARFIFIFRLEVNSFIQKRRSFMTTATRINLSNTSSLSEALEQFNFEAVPMALLRADGKSVDSHKAIIRGDTGIQLGIVGIDYSIIQMLEASAMIRTIVSSTEGAKLHSATIFDDGRRCHITASIGEFAISGGRLVRDSIRKLISVVNSFDGSSHYSVLFEEERVVCSNGMKRRSKESEIKLRHSGDVDSKLLEALRIMGLAQKHFAEFEAMCNKLAQQILDKKTVDGLIKAVVGDLESTRSQNIAGEIEALLNGGVETYGQTRWDALNAVTEYYDHHAGKDADKRLASSMIGNGSHKKIAALEYLLSA
jgi:phage/plasmid-like protein (TIGR03299 family)